MSDDPPFFRLFNEIGIVNQLASTLFEAKLPHGLLVSHFALVNHLARGRDGTTAHAMARAFQTPKTTMSHMLGVLSRHGYIEMRPHPKDGRMKTVWLTDAGRSFRQEAVAALEPDVSRLTEAFGREWADQTVERLTALRKWLDADRDR